MTVITSIRLEEEILDLVRFVEVKFQTGMLFIYFFCFLQYTLSRARIINADTKDVENDYF